MLRIIVGAVLLACSALVAPVAAQFIIPFGPPEYFVKLQIIEECREIYNQRQRCACPQDMEHICSGVSSYERRKLRGAPAPFCNPSDIPLKVVNEYRKGVKTTLLRHCRAKR